MLFLCEILACCSMVRSCDPVPTGVDYHSPADGEGVGMAIFRFVKIQYVASNNYLRDYSER